MYSGEEIDIIDEQKRQQQSKILKVLVTFLLVGVVRAGDAISSNNSVNICPNFRNYKIFTGLKSIINVLSTLNVANCFKCGGVHLTKE